MTSTDTAQAAKTAWITGGNKPAHMIDNSDDGLTASTIYTGEQAREYAVTVAGEMNKVFLRWHRWFIACNKHSAAMVAAGVYEAADRQAELDIIYANGLEGGPKGRRPREASSHELYSRAHTLRSLLLAAGATEVPGRPHSMEGLDVVLAYAHNFLGLARKTAN